MDDIRLISAQAEMHHAFLMGLQLMISTNKGPDVVGNWMFRLFRRQHLDKFLSSFEKLGLTGLPDAVACAKYHVMSNSIGGVPVEYIYETDKKAWVRFRYPRWLYQGPTICGVPQSVSRGFLEGWYAYNGISLDNPRLGYVCVSEDMTGEFGLCGYFQEYEHELTQNERLRFAKGELPPPYKVEEQPQLPSTEWDELRLGKANRNYAMEYIRNGVRELAEVIGERETLELAGRAARLIGLQYGSQTRNMICTQDGDLDTAAEYLQLIFRGLGDETEALGGQPGVVLRQTGLRIVRGLGNEERYLLLKIWVQLWQGAMSSYRQMKVAKPLIESDAIIWHLEERV